MALQRSQDIIDQPCGNEFVHEIESLFDINADLLGLHSFCIVWFSVFHWCIKRQYVLFKRHMTLSASPLRFIEQLRKTLVIETAYNMIGAHQQRMHNTGRA